MDNKVEDLVGAVVDIGHRHGENVTGGSNGRDQVLGFAGKFHKLDDDLQGLGGDMVRVMFAQLGHRDGVGKYPDFFLSHGRDLLDLGELGLVHGEEIIPSFVDALVEQTVVGQDLLMFECIGKQELSEVGFDALHFFSFEVFENPSND